MSKYKVPIIIAAVVVAGILWYLFRPELLFINQSVNEQLPGTTLATAKDNSPKVLSSGNFYGVAHETQGIATIYNLAAGKRVLRFSNFETSNGPAVKVYLASAKSPKDNDAVTQQGYVSLGPIKGNKGDQNYDIPADINLAEYGSVVIWCERFGVNFGAASLAMSATEPEKLSEGSFYGVAHETRGNASIYRLADGKRVLRFTNFETSNGPQVRVYLAVAPNAKDNDVVTKQGFYSLGAIKGNKGDQNYEIPADVNLGDYHSVVIWCERFGVNFGAATLAQKERLSRL